MGFYYFRSTSFFIDWFIVLTEMGIIKLPELPKEEIPILKKTKTDIKKEWKETDHRGITQSMIEVHYTFDGLNNGIGYYQQQLANKDNINFYELGTIKDRLETQKEPSNLANYIKDRHPFDRWNNRGLTY
ncbi:hypothetical protein PAWBP_6400 [Paulownia witches'-broom phytoplasma]|nr:hypothetical protein PAWBP_6400 [Paulownia witches'-broom phytoplasma]